MLEKAASNPELQTLGAPTSETLTGVGFRVKGSGFFLSVVGLGFRV